MNPDDAPSPLPKITLPLWAYVALIFFVLPIGGAILTGQDWQPVAATALLTFGGTIGLRQVVLAPKVQAAALVHRDLNLALGYAQGEQDAAPAPPAKKARPSRKPAAKKQP